MHLLLALDQGFGPLAAVALTSYLLHHRFSSVVLVTPADQRMSQLEGIAAAFDCHSAADIGRSTFNVRHGHIRHHPLTIWLQDAFHEIIRQAKTRLRLCDAKAIAPCTNNFLP